MNRCALKLWREASMSELGEAERRAAFNHLIEYRILRDQMQGSAPAEATGGWSNAWIKCAPSGRRKKMKESGPSNT